MPPVPKRERMQTRCEARVARDGIRTLLSRPGENLSIARRRPQSSQQKGLSPDQIGPAIRVRAARMPRKAPSIMTKRCYRSSESESSKMKLRPVSAGLNQVSEECLPWMRPGDIILLGDAASLRAMIETAFFAVLACPWCGMPGLITSAQYSGSESIICRSDFCSCRFRIEKESRFEFLLAS